jgi:hypothetical protein
MGIVTQNAQQIYVQCEGNSSGISDVPEGGPFRQARAEPVRHGREGRSSIGRNVVGTHGRRDVADSTCMISLTCPGRSKSINVHGQSALVCYNVARVVAMGISIDVAKGSRNYVARSSRV